MPCIDDITPAQLVILSVVLSFILADDRDADDLNVLGEFLSAIGDLVSLMAAQKERSESLKDKEITKQNIMKQIRELQLQCEKLN